MEKKIIEMRGIVKRFFIGSPNEIEVLKGIDLDVYEGEFLAVVGQSGSGKSTLMNIIGTLDRPTEGSYILDGINIGESKDKELSGIRNKKIGFVFQTYNLIAKTDAIKNVEVPMLYAGMGMRERHEKSRELLEMVGMSDRIHHLPEELSGGQKQRVAIARAMANDPSIILADEPTGNLDTKNRDEIYSLLGRVRSELGQTIVIVTHDERLAAQTDRKIVMSDGAIL